MQRSSLDFPPRGTVSKGFWMAQHLSSAFTSSFQGQRTPVLFHSPHLMSTLLCSEPLISSSPKFHTPSTFCNNPTFSLFVKMLYGFSCADSIVAMGPIDLTSSDCVPADARLMDWGTYSLQLPWLPATLGT